MQLYCLLVVLQNNAVNEKVCKNNILFTYDFCSYLFKLIILLPLFVFAIINNLTYILLNLGLIVVIFINLVIFKLDFFLIISPIDICIEYSVTGIFVVR